MIGYGRAVYSDEISRMKIKLPVKSNLKGEIYLDNLFEYSDDGYVPDWDFIENYVKSLSYGDRL